MGVNLQLYYYLRPRGHNSNRQLSLLVDLLSRVEQQGVDSSWLWWGNSVDQWERRRRKRSESVARTTVLRERSCVLWSSPFLYFSFCACCCCSTWLPVASDDHSSTRCYTSIFTPLSEMDDPRFSHIATDPRFKVCIRTFTFCFSFLTTAYPLSRLYLLLAFSFSSSFSSSFLYIFFAFVSL